MERRYSILIIEDESDWRQTLKDTLREYEVNEASSFEEAEEQLAKRQHDLILLDVGFDQPGFNLLCQDLCRRICASNPNASLFAMSGKKLTTQEMAWLFMGYHPVDFIDKPALERNDFRNRIMKALTLRRPLSAKVVRTRVLFIGAHCDDIEIGCGGIAAKCADGQCAIAFAIATNCGAERTREAQEAAKQLSLTEDASNLFVGRVQDGQLDSNKELLRSWLKEVKAKFNPETVFVHHGGDTHSDHKALYEASIAVFAQPQGSPENRPYGVSKNPANGIGTRRARRRAPATGPVVLSLFPYCPRILSISGDRHNWRPAWNRVDRGASACGSRWPDFK